MMGMQETHTVKPSSKASKKPQCVDVGPGWPVVLELPLDSITISIPLGRACLRTALEKWPGVGAFLIFRGRKDIACAGWLTVTQNFWVLPKQAMTSGNPIVCYLQGRKC